MGAVLGPFRVRKLPVCIVVQNTLWLVVLAAGGSTAVKTVWLCSGRLVVLTVMGKGCHGRGASRSLRWTKAAASFLDFIDRLARSLLSWKSRACSVRLMGAQLGLSGLAAKGSVRRVFLSRVPAVRLLVGAQGVLSHTAGIGLSGGAIGIRIVAGILAGRDDRTGSGIVTVTAEVSGAGSGSDYGAVWDDRTGSGILAVTAGVSGAATVRVSSLHGVIGHCTGVRATILRVPVSVLAS